MFKGIVFAMSACFFWGLIYVVPQFLQGFTSVEVALGRYFFYGIISAGIFIQAKWQGTCHYPLKIWGKALYFSLASTMVYYTALVLAIRCCAPAVCALVLGTSPITIALYGNWREKECSYKSLLLPSALVLFGLVLINVPHIKAAESISSYILGLFLCTISLASWSWYVVANTKFFQKNPEVTSNDWTTLIGVCALFWAAICSFFFSFTDQFQIEKYLILTPELGQYIVGCIILGLFSSWCGSFLWNKASHYLPVTLAGQLTIFETIFGLVFVYALEQTLPPPLEAIGILVLLGAVGYGIRLFSTLQKEAVL